MAIFNLYFFFLNKQICSSPWSQYNRCPKLNVYIFLGLGIVSFLPVDLVIFWMVYVLISCYFFLIFNYIWIQKFQISKCSIPSTIHIIQSLLSFIFIRKLKDFIWWDKNTPYIFRTWNSIENFTIRYICQRFGNVLSSAFHYLPCYSPPFIIF